MSEVFVLGWEEWVALPDLDLPAIKAKVDTGAKTSALHAFFVEPFGPPSRRMVRFGVHPIPGRNDVEVICTADVIDHREVTSSNGESEMRYVIRTSLKLGERTWPIELTLANRETMSYRMLIGRQAIRDDMLVDPATSFRQPRLSYRRYDIPPRTAEDRRPLTIGLLTRRPDNATNRRIQRVAERRGHKLVMIDRDRVSLFIDTSDPAILLDGTSAPQCDALIVRPGRGTPTFSAAVARQFETLGAVVINGPDALLRVADPLATRQLLARAGIPVPAAAVSSAASHPDAADRHLLADGFSSHALGLLVRHTIVGSRAVAAMVRSARGHDDIDAEAAWHSDDPAPIDATRAVAEQAARVLGLEFAGVDVVAAPQGPIVVGVTVSPAISLAERVTGAAICEAIVVYIEQTARPLAR
ncbi:MAG: RimK/LysX family protein [Hyphomicrobiaceae bacterium]